MKVRQSIDEPYNHRQNKRINDIGGDHVMHIPFRVSTFPLA